MKNKIIISAGVILLGTQATCIAANYPTQYQIFGAGYQKSMPLQEKLELRRGEFYHKRSGLYFGAQDTVHNDYIPETSKSNREAEHNKVDAYAGLKKQLGIFGYHLGVKSYNQLFRADTLDKEIEVQEMYVGGNIKSLYVSYATNNDGAYTQLNVKHDISNLTLGFHLGKTDSNLGDDFTDWSLFATKAINDMKLNAIMTQSDDPNNSDLQINFGIEKELSLF